MVSIRLKEFNLYLEKYTKRVYDSECAQYFVNLHVDEQKFNPLPKFRAQDFQENLNFISHVYDFAKAVCVGKALWSYPEACHI